MTSVVVPLGLFLAGCDAQATPEPAPVPAPTALPPTAPPPTANPPPPTPVDAQRPSAPLPTWAEALSGHPPGATNPPSPVLLVTPEGRCHQQWVSPFVPAPYHQDRVAACPNPDPLVGDCGVEVQCPPDAAARTAPKP